MLGFGENKKRAFSYAEKQNQRHHIRWLALAAGIFFLAFNLLNTFCFSMRVLRNTAMEPGLRPGDRVACSSYRLRSLLPDGAQETPFARGEVVLIDRSLARDRGVGRRILDTVVRFFTLQRVSLFDREEHFYLKRVIGLPGDEISITNFVLRVQPQGENYGFTEFELSGRPYDVTIPQMPALWGESLPFYGSMERRVLGEDECFVLSDDRSNTNDSRTWGPLPVSLVAGKLLFRYWPLTRLGQP